MDVGTDIILPTVSTGMAIAVALLTYRVAKIEGHLKRSRRMLRGLINWALTEDKKHLDGVANEPED